MDVKKRVSRRIPNMSIRIDRDIVYMAKIEAVKSKMTLGAWLEEAIREKIERDTKHGKKE